MKNHEGTRKASIYILALLVTAALILGLAGCGEPVQELSVKQDRQTGGVTVTSEPIPDGTTGSSILTSITVGENQCLIIYPHLKQGSLFLQIESGEDSVYEDSLAGTTAFYQVLDPGDYNVIISSDSAEGSLQLVPYDRTTVEMHNEDPGVLLR